MNSNETKAGVSPVLSNDGLGAVLTYRTKGHNRPCGQTIGANGAGEFAVLISGKPEDAWAFAGEYLRDLERRGYRIEEAILVTNEECYSGPQIITAQAPNAPHKPRSEAESA